MAQYISKDALVAEIERRIKSLHQVNSPREQEVLYECKDILSFIDSLEVKEVDLEKMSRHYALKNSPWDCVGEIQDAYKAGFELGVKVEKGE